MVREALTAKTLTGLEPRAAAAYFIARRAEGLTSSEEQLLANWLAQEEGHRRAFAAAERAWQCFSESEGDEILEAMRRHALSPRSRRLPSWRPVAVAAATLLVVIGGALVLNRARNPGSPAPADPASGAPIQYVSARGEIKQVPLPDGSTLTLDADSAATGRFGPDGRTIELSRGRAFFAVRPDRSRPFSVTANGLSIVAVGTRFDVGMAAGALTVTLVDGRLELGSRAVSAEPTVLEAGQQYVQSGGRATIRTLGAATENEVAWRTGLINFDDQTLGEAAAVMNRYSDDQIIITDASVASLRVSGQFRAGDVQRFAATLAEVHGLRSVRQGTRIELLR